MSDKLNIDANNEGAVTIANGGAVLSIESWKMYFDHANAYMDAASALAQADLYSDARKMLDKAREANRICRENFASANRR